MKRRSILQCRMSAFGTKRTSRHARPDTAQRPLMTQSGHGRGQLAPIRWGKNRSEKFSISLSAHGTLPCRRRTGRLFMVAMIERV